MHAFTVWLVLTARHWFRVVVVAFFLLAFVTFATASRSDWLGGAISAALGLLFGVIFAVGNELPEILES